MKSLTKAVPIIKFFDREYSGTIAEVTPEHLDEYMLDRFGIRTQSSIDAMGTVKIIVGGSLHEVSRLQKELRWKHKILSTIDGDKYQIYVQPNN